MNRPISKLRTPVAALLVALVAAVSGCAKEQEVQRQNELNAGNAGALKNLQTAQAELNALHTRKASLQQQIQLMGINPNLVSNNNLKSALVVASPLNGTISNCLQKSAVM